MAFPSTIYRLVIALNGYDGPEYYQAGDGNMKPGMVVMEDDADEVKVCISTAKPLGIVGCDADHDLGTAYSAGERIPIYPLGCGVDIYVLCQDAGAMAITKSLVMDSSDLTTYAGMGHLADTPEATTVVTVRNASSWFWSGTALETATITTAIARYVPVKLSF
jgi:hypothetical protein